MPIEGALLKNLYCNGNHHFKYKLWIYKSNPPNILVKASRNSLDSIILSNVFDEIECQKRRKAAYEFVLESNDFFRNLFII